MKYVSINANDVKKMFKVCGACIDTSGARECLQYIKIEVRGNKATAIGCDGFRLAAVTFDTITKDGADFDFFVKPAQIGINAKMLAEILNAIKDYGQNKRVVITVDADSATRPVFIETPDDTTKIMLCTCRNK